MGRLNGTAAITIAGALLSTTALAAGSDQDLLNLSLDQLTNIEVTSVSKKSEKATEAAAAIYVITQEDIRRSGASSIPEALRAVPGIQVAQSGSHQWAVTSRGFNDQFANKLLVLVDGRSIYTPLFSGVWWDAQDTLMEDIDRIEVIRGPGATLWGANAVNGVINIITKNAKDTQGGLLSAGAGNSERGFGGGRYGGKINENAYYRGYAKYFNRDESRTMTDSGSDDKWSKGQVGFRVDWDKNSNHNFTFQGDAYQGSTNTLAQLPVLTAPFVQSANSDEDIKGANLLMRWNYNISDNSDTSVQIYYDTISRHNLVLDESRDTFDVDFQHAWSPTERHEIVWGLGYRLMVDHLGDSLYINFSPDSRQDNLFSAFIQDKIALIPDDLFLTLGSKFEHNDYTGFELQPSGRLSWLINDSQTLWGAVSRAVRTPSRGNEDNGNTILTVVPTVPAFVANTGNRNVDSEELISYELGYRIQPVKTVSLDLAAFYNDYNNGFSNVLLSPTIQSGFGLPFYPVIPITNGNSSTAQSKGVELSAKWDATSYWQLTANYTYLKLNFKNVGTGYTFEGKSPQQQFSLLSYLTLPNNWEWDNALYFNDNLDGIGIGDYVRFDTRLGWKPVEGIELSLVGQNLLDPEHPEFTPFLYNNPSQIGRSYYGKITWRF